MRLFFALSISLGLLVPLPAWADDARPKTIILVAGKKSHGPVGNGVHDYGWSARLLKVMLEQSNIKDRVRVETFDNDGPADLRAYDNADAIMVISDGRDGDKFAEAPHLASPERVRYFDGLTKRGCGFLTFHFSTFTPNQYAEQVLNWSGGMFEWEKDGKRQWTSAIKTIDSEVQLGSPDHPIARGVKPFKLREEFHHNLRFTPDKALKPILLVSALKGREPDGNVVAWAREREGGGRGFGTTCGHFYDNWKNDDFRKLMLNAIAWCAKVEVPKDGVEAKFCTHEEINQVLGPYPPAAPAPKPAGDAATKPLRVLLLAGNDAHKWHNWEKTTPAIRDLLERDPRVRVDVVTDIEELAKRKLSDYAVIVQNYVNWQDPKGLSEAARTALVSFVKDGGGLVVVHFANGAFHYSLPGAQGFDWPEYRQLVRRVWNHQPKEGQLKGAHDAFGKFTVRPTDTKHPVIDGLKAFEVTDELYFHQDGTEPIDPLIVAESKVTKKLEPLAWASSFGKGRVFQTLLGHSEKTYDSFEAREMLRRAVAWAAGQEVKPLTADVEKASTALNYQPADPKLKAVLIDRSPNDAYMAAKVDSIGRVFVGGRQAVYCFEPDGRGGYTKRLVHPFPQDSIIIGLELRGNDLYVLTCNALYRLPDGRTKRDGIAPERLLWGLPVDLHVSFHCLAWGPEGDLYLNHGDPLLNFGDWNRPDHWGHWTLYHKAPGGAAGEWAKLAYTGVGCVLRLKPDGTQPRIVATGFRGPVGLAFDKHWNLFTNDNDHESRADLYAPARLMQVTPYSDFAWPRGWLASKSPTRADLLDNLTNNLGRGVPCDLVSYDEDYLGADYRGNLFMDRWDRLGISRYPLQPHGATFRTEEQPLLNGKNQVRPVGITVGRGGRVFATALYLAGNVATPNCPSDLFLITRADDSADCPFDGFDIATAPTDRLWAELSTPSGSRRREAHAEILRRGGALLDEATRRLASVKEGDPAEIHLPWLAAASGSAEASRQLQALAKHARPELRLQAIRALTTFPALKAPREVFVTALVDADPAVQLAALAYFFDAAGEMPTAAVVALARSEDTYLRQTATRLLARRAPLAELLALTKSDDTPTRLAGILAAGVRLTVPAVDSVPPEAVKVSYSAGNAHFNLLYADAQKPVDIRTLARVGSYTTAQWWKAIQPDAEQRQLFETLFAALDEPAGPVKQQATNWLTLLNDPRSEDKIHAQRQDAQLAALATAPRRAVEKTWTVGPFADQAGAFQPAHAPEQGAIDLAAEYPGKHTWQETTTCNGSFALAAPTASSSTYAYFRLYSAHKQPVALHVGTDGAAKVWHNGSVVRSAKPAVLLELQPGSNDVLVRVQHARAATLALHVQAKSEVSATLPEKLDSASLAARLREAGTGSAAEKIGPEFVSVDWAADVRKADLAAGRKLFGSLGCAKCHAVTNEQKGGGAPSLAEAKKRFTIPHLVESVLLPSKQVAEPFRASTLGLSNGQFVTGLVVGETADTIEVLLPDATRKAIRKADVEQRTVTLVSPMPAGLVKKPEELRDLLGYLLGDNPTPP